MKRRHRFPIPGTPPATLLKRVGDDAKPPTFRVYEFGEGFYEETKYDSVDAIPVEAGAGHRRWIEMYGLSDPAALEALGAKFHLHRLALEDALNTGQRAKVEHYDEHLFIVVHMLYYDGSDQLCSEQVSIFIRDDTLITIQEEEELDVFEPLRTHLRQGQGHLRTGTSAFLAYAMLDAIVDNVFPALEKIGDSVEGIEEELLAKPDRSCAHRIHRIKRLLMHLRRVVWPMRDVVNALLHDESERIDKQTKIYLRDCYDHTVQIMDFVESYRDVASGLMEMYHSAISVRTNEIMRVLTVISSIFIPLTFVAGVYGMNFAWDDGQKPLNMPELHQPHGYIVCMAIMAAIAVGQILFFRRKGWL